MKTLLSIIFLLIAACHISCAQTLTFRSSKKAVYAGNNKLLEYNANYHSIILINKDSIVYVDANSVEKLNVRLINSNKKRNANVFSYLCDKKYVVTMDIKKGIVTIQKVGTTYVFSEGVFTTNFKNK